MPSYFEALGKPPRDGKPRKNKPSPSHVRAAKQERSTALRLGGKTTPRSGAGDIKGDVRIQGVLRIECKTTKHRSFTVTLDMFKKIEDAGLSGNEMPAILIEFNNGKGEPLCELAVVPSYILDHLCLKSV